MFELFANRGDPDQSEMPHSMALGLGLLRPVCPNTWCVFAGLELRN